MSCFARCALAAAVGGVLLVAPLGICVAQQNAPGGLEEPHYKCDTEGVQLEGMLTVRTFYGPPGFGETPSKDAREKVLILRLAKPIRVVPVADVKANKGSCWGDFPHLAAIQLFIPEAKPADAQNLIGKQVVAVGMLREGDAPSEHTKIIMEVKTVDRK